MLTGTIRRLATAAMCLGTVAVAAPDRALAAPVTIAGHDDMAWVVTDAAGSPPPNSFGGGGGRPWGGPDRTWSQPGFTGSYRISLDGVTVSAYCGDFHNPTSPDAASRWVDDRTAFAGSDKALAKLSYAQWRWGSTTDADTAAALNLYTHFLGSPGDRSNSSGVPVPDINDNDILDEVVVVSAPHAAVGQIMATIDIQAEAWSAAFDHQPVNIGAGLTVTVDGRGEPAAVSTATGRALPVGSFDVLSNGRSTTVTTAGVARPLRDISVGSQNSVTIGTPQTARAEAMADITVSSQISDHAPGIGTALTDAITIAGLIDGETATIAVELFDLSIDPTGAGDPLARETRTGLVNGTTEGWARFDVTTPVAGHVLGYRHRLEAVSPDTAVPVRRAWSELGIASESGTAAEVDAIVHLRKTISSSSEPTWINAQRAAPATHHPAAALSDAAGGSHDDGAADAGDGRPIYLDGDAVSFRYEVWLDPSSTGDVVWTIGPNGTPSGVLTDDAGTEGGDDDFTPTFLLGDNGDGRLTRGEVWTFEARDRRRAAAGEEHENTATALAGTISNPTTKLPTKRTTATRTDPAGYLVPCLSTSVRDQLDGDRTIEPGGGVIIDTATFCNLVPGTEYRIDGVVMDDRTGQPTQLRGSTTFTPHTASGTVDVMIDVKIDAATDTKIDAVVDISPPAKEADVVARRYVVFETVVVADSGEFVAKHADLDDAAQTFIVLPAVEETPPAPESTTTTSVPPVSTAPPSTVPPPPTPTTAGPPRLPKTGDSLTQILLLIAIFAFTAGVVAVEVRHPRRPDAITSGVRHQR